jgi:hypothetical protein
MNSKQLDKKWKDYLREQSKIGMGYQIVRIEDMRKQLQKKTVVA